MARRAAKKGVFTKTLETPKMLRKIPKSMKDLRNSLLDYSDAFREMPPIFQQGVIANINSKGSTIGETWDPNSKAYKVRKAAEGKGNVPLEYTKDLKRKIASGAGIKFRIRKRGMMWGTKKIPYARAVHFGGQPFFVISPQMNAKILVVMDKHTTQKVKKATRVLRALDGK